MKLCIASEHYPHTGTGFCGRTYLHREERTPNRNDDLPRTIMTMVCRNGVFQTFKSDIELRFIAFIRLHTLPYCSICRHFLLSKHPKRSPVEIKRPESRWLWAITPAELLHAVGTHHTATPFCCLCTNGAELSPHMDIRGTMPYKTSMQAKQIPSQNSYSRGMWFKVARIGCGLYRGI